MLKVTPVNSVKELKKDDLLLIQHRHGSNIGRIDCIDGENLFIVSPHKNLPIRFPNGEDHFKATLESFLTNHQVLRIHSEETNS